MTLKVLLLCINWQTQLQKRQKDQEHTGNGIELVRQADNAEENSLNTDNNMEQNEK